ncbi:MAG TPA: NAD(P)H-hydrate epimerase [Phycisphaerae bacterium]|nr:NAD(P)H-hydrate epimerase [Phycisphaerae bacterium]
MGIPYPPGEALTCQQIRDLDVLAIEHAGVPGLVLMENAGRAAAEFVYGALVNPRAARVAILCGPGNNGGDGFVIARHLSNAGVAIDVVLAAPPEKSTGDAGVNLRILERMGLELIRAFEERGRDAAQNAVARADLIVDALLGTGSTGAPRAVMATLIELANAAPRARGIAIDIPSGLDADRGAVQTPCFRADATVTMVAPKVGFETPAAQAVVGRVVVVDIGAPRGLIPGRRPA